MAMVVASRADNADFAEFEVDNDVADTFEAQEKKAMASGGGGKVFTKVSGKQDNDVVRKGDGFTVVRPQSAGTVRSSSAGRGRPSSANNRSHYRDMKMGDMLKRSPTTWNVSEVAMWMEEIGFTNHRSKFVHNCVDGRLLLRLTDSNLKVDMGITVLGHRVKIMDEIKMLKETMDSGGGAPRARPQSAGPRQRPGSEKGGALGALSNEEWRAKLMRDLDRARSDANLKQTRAENMMRQAQLAQQEVRRIRGQLLEVEKKVKRAHRDDTKIDLDALVPWRPVRVAAKDSATDAREFSTSDRSNETFKPKITASSIRIMGGDPRDRGKHMSQGDVDTSWKEFISRMESKEKTRKSMLKSKKKDFARMAKGAEAEAEEAAANTKFLTKLFKDQLGKDYQGLNSTGDQQIDTYAVELLEKSWTTSGEGSEYERRKRVTQEQIKTVEGIKENFRKRALMLEEFVKSNWFMQRYYQDLATRKRNEKDTKSRVDASLQGAQYKPQTQRDEEDKTGFVDYFRRLGWDRPANRAENDEASDKRLNALLERVNDVREAAASGQPLEEEAADDVLSALARKPLLDGKRAGRELSSEEDRDMRGRQSAALEDTVRLLAAMPVEDISKCRKLSGEKKRLACYRALKRQVFLARTADDLRQRERKLEEALGDTPRAPRADRGQAAEEFMDRLEKDLMAREEKKRQLAEKERRRKEELVLRGVY